MSTSTTPRTKIPVIIDTDPGVDDTIAILMALTSPELEILGYTISFGNTDIAASYANIYRIYQAVQKEVDYNPEARSRFPGFFQDRKPFLAKGAEGPLGGELHTAQYFHGRDGLGNATQNHPDLDVPLSVIEAPEHPKLAPTPRPGFEVGLEMLREFPARAITYIVLGPMTNLALMMREDPKLVRERIGRVSVMGGAFDVPGNKTASAEFNWFADPYAVAELLTPAPSNGLPPPHQGLPLSRVLILPLDITTKHILFFPLYTETIDKGFHPQKHSIAEGKSPMSHFTSAFLQRTRRVMNERGKDAMEMHDVAAVWAAVANPPVQDAADEAAYGLADGWNVTRRKFVMERTGEWTRGMCVIDRRHSGYAYAPGPNRAEMQAALDRENIKHGPFESTALPAQVMVENKAQTKSATEGLEGVPIVTRSPGSEVLVNTLFERIWGVKS